MGVVKTAFLAGLTLVISILLAVMLGDALCPQSSGVGDYYASFGCDWYRLIPALLLWIIVVAVWVGGITVILRNLNKQKAKKPGLITILGTITIPLIIFLFLINDAFMHFISVNTPLYRPEDVALLLLLPLYPLMYWWYHYLFNGFGSRSKQRK